MEQYLSQIGYPDGSVRPTQEHDNHLPLCKLNTDTAENAVEVVGGKMAELLSRQFDDENAWRTTAVQYPMNEIIDNVDDHSGCDNGALLVQQYPNKPFLDVGVADDGITIPRNFEQTAVEFETDTDAIRMAAVEGKSTKLTDGSQRGYGLRTVTNMICDGLNGEVLIASRNGTVHMENGSAVSEILPDAEWPGTAFVARLYPPDESFDFRRYLE